MTKLRLIIAAIALMGISACSSFSIDKERAAEQRKNDLCKEIDTRDLPHCNGTLPAE